MMAAHISATPVPPPKPKCNGASKEVVLQDEFSLPLEPQILHLIGLILQIFRIKPPMCITKEDVDFAVSVFETAIRKQQMT